MHTRRFAYPAERQRLAVRLLDRRWHTSGTVRRGSDPPVRGPGTGSRPIVFAHSCLRPLGRYRTIDPCGKAVRRPLTLRINRSSSGWAAAVAQTARAGSPTRVRTRSRWPRPPTATLVPDTALLVCQYAARSVWVSTAQSVGGTVGHRGEADNDTIAEVTPAARSEYSRFERALAFLQRIDGLGATPGEGWDDVHIPTSADATAGIERRGSLRSRPPLPARHSRPGGRDATIIRTTTYAVADMHVRSGVSRTPGSVSHVRPSHGTGRASRVRPTVSPDIRARHAPSDPR